MNAQLYDDIINIWEEAKSVPFTSRKRLPIITLKQKEILNDVNTCLNKIIENTSPDLSEVYAVFFAAAVYICRACGFTINLVCYIMYPLCSCYKWDKDYVCVTCKPVACTVCNYIHDF